jgi:CheY-like chemotaxis protein
MPAIALTAFARPEDRLKAQEVGFACHVSKPLEAAEFVSTVARVLSRGAVEEQLSATTPAAWSAS